MIVNKVRWCIKIINRNIWWIMLFNRIILGFICGGIKCDVISGEFFMCDIFVWYEYYGYKVCGGCYRGG